MSIEVSNLTKTFGDLKVLDGISLSIADAGITAILGPSGCGKTTFLNLLSGSDSEYQGSIRGNENSRISYLFQEPRLLPWQTVKQNIEFVLKNVLPERQLQERTGHFLEVVGLSDFAGYYPPALSGGMKQRTSIARAFAFPSDVLLMDEPFQALDLKLKLSLLSFFEKLWTEEQRAAIFVTHDIQEALLLGDDIFVFSELPARVKDHMKNTVPHPERALGHREILAIERKLYDLLV